MATQRLAWFDNVKGILIFLVVFGHLLELYRTETNNGFALWLYNTLFVFHMPLFILISGYFYREGRYKKIIQFTIVYLIWQVINGMAKTYLDTHTLPTFSGKSDLIKLFVPYWTLWFLLGTIFWRAITPYFLKLRYPILISILIALWANYIQDFTTWFSLRKLIDFYPFYLIGYTLAQREYLTVLIDKLKTRGRLMRLGASSFLLVFLLFMVYFTTHKFNTDFLFMRDSYHYFGWSFLKGSMYSLFYYAGVSLICLAIMIVVPSNKKLFLFNRMGFYSLFIYLLHVNLVRLFRHLVPKELTHQSLTLVPLALLVAIFIGSMVSSKWIIKVFSILIEPRIGWITTISEK